MSITDAFNGFITQIVSVLPLSPFREYIDQFSNIPYIGYLNWFFPVSECLVVFSSWLFAYSMYLIYSVIMRWVKLIGD